MTDRAVRWIELTALAVALAVVGLFALDADLYGQAKPAGCYCAGSCTCKPGTCPACPALPAQANPPSMWSAIQAFQVRECSGTSCRVVNYVWCLNHDTPRRHILVRDGRTVGGWDYDTCLWLDIDPRTDDWDLAHPKREPPFPVPGLGVAAEAQPAFGQDVPNYGMDLDKMPKSDGQHHYWVGGREVERRHAFGVFGAAEPEAGKAIPNDADTLKVTWVGAAATGETIRRDLAALPAWAGKVSFQSYSSLDEAILRGRGFADGLMIEAPDGRPLFSAAKYHVELLPSQLSLASERRDHPAWKPRSWAEAAVVAKAKPAAADEPPTPDQAADPLAWLKRNWLIPVIVGGVLLLLRRQQPK